MPRRSNKKTDTERKVWKYWWYRGVWTADPPNTPVSCVGIIRRGGGGLPPCELTVERMMVIRNGQDYMFKEIEMPEENT